MDETAITLCKENDIPVSLLSHGCVLPAHYHAACINNMQSNCRGLAAPSGSVVDLKHNDLHCKGMHPWTDIRMLCQS